LIIFATRRERFPLVTRRYQHFREGIEMKSFLAFVLISALGVFIIGCDSQKGTTDDRTQTTTTQTKDGKVVGETTTTNETKMKATTPADSGMTTEKTTRTTTETTK